MQLEVLYTYNGIFHTLLKDSKMEEVGYFIAYIKKYGYLSQYSVLNCFGQLSFLFLLSHMEIIYGYNEIFMVLPRRHSLDDVGNVMDDIKEYYYKDQLFVEEKVIILS